MAQIPNGSSQRIRFHVKKSWRLCSAISQHRHIPRRFFYEEAKKPRTIGKNFWFPGFLMELILGAASLRCSAIRQNHHKPRRFFKATTAGLCSAGFLTCCIADFPVGRTLAVVQSAGLETRDTADLEVCATGVAALR